MSLKLTNTFEKLTNESVERLEKDLSFSLPNLYKIFLIHNNGGRPSKKTFKTANKKYESDIQFFFGITEDLLYDIRSKKEVLSNRISLEFLPIANDGLGNTILLNLETEEIYFFDHEIEESFLINSSFSEFIKNLYVKQYEQTDLEQAIGAQNISYFKNLLKDGTDINSLKDEFDQNLLLSVSLRNKLKIVEFLVNNGAKVDGALFNAASNGHLEIVKFLLEKGADPNERDKEQNNDTALIQASFGGYLDVVKLLINCGADLNLKDDHGQTALNKAYWSDNKEFIDYLEKISQ